jgi:hypothetical protein
MEVISSVSVVQRRYTSYTGEFATFLFQFHYLQYRSSASVEGMQRQSARMFNVFNIEAFRN